MSAAAKCEPIINAYAGFSYDSSRKVDPARLNEEQNRMSIKSQNWVFAELNSRFHIEMMEHVWVNRIAGYEDTFAHQDLYCVFMGL
jgi:hypothetical protein